jgi:uncharacterized protein (TIGR02271 family)
LLVAEVPDGKDTDRIIRLLEQSMIAAPSPVERSRTAGGDAGEILDEVRIPQVAEEIRIGKRAIERGGARVRSFVRETPAEEAVTLRQEHVAVDTRPAERRLTDSDVETAGLLKERVIEVSEMREEPVVTKSAVVREEVILKKEVTERTETVRETLRHTEIEVEELPVLAPASSDVRDQGRKETGRT